MRRTWIVVAAMVSLGLAQGEESAEEVRARKVRELIELNGFADTVCNAARWADRPAERGEILDLIAPAYAKHLDDETLEAALAFFRSDAGKKYAASQKRAEIAAYAAASRLPEDGGGGREGKVRAAEAKCKEYYDTAITWRVMSDRKKLPESLEQMEAPLRPGEADFLKVDVDPWGRKYVLRVEGGKLTVLSFGPDGVEGTKDDIAYPGRPPQGEKSIEERVRRIVCERMGVARDKVRDEASFTEDLGADDLDTVELIMEFEDEFDLSISDEDAAEIRTVGDAIRYVKDHVK